MELWDTKTREGYPRRNSILKHLLFGVAPEKLPVIEDPALQNAKFPLWFWLPCKCRLNQCMVHFVPMPISLVHLRTGIYKGPLFIIYCKDELGIFFYNYKNVTVCALQLTWWPSLVHTSPPLVLLIKVIFDFLEVSLAQSAQVIVFGRRNSSTPKLALKRPKPLRLTPPCGRLKSSCTVIRLMWTALSFSSAWWLCSCAPKGTTLTPTQSA